MKPLNLGQADALPDYHFEERGGAKIWINRKFHGEELLDLLADCDQLLVRSNCQIIKDQRKIKIGRLTLIVKDKALAVYIKRYNTFSMRYRIGSLLSESGAVRSLRGAKIVQSAGICTPTPIAAIDVREKGVLCRSFFVTEEIAGGKTVDAYWREVLATRGERQRRKFLTRLATLFRSLHLAGIYHNDLKDANIIVAPRLHHASYNFTLLDLDGVRQYGNLSERRRIKNLVQINRTLGQYVRWSDKAYFMRRYFAEGVTDREEMKRLIRLVLAESQRRDVKVAAL